MKGNSAPIEKQATVDELLQRLCIVFEKLRRSGLKLSPKKCQLFQKEVHYIGFPISEKIIIIKKIPTTVQICRLENIEHVSYNGKYSFSACRTHQSHLQFSFVVPDVFCSRFLHVEVLNYQRESIPTKKKTWR